MVMIKIKIAGIERHCSLGGCIIAIFVVYSITNMRSLMYLKKSIICCVQGSKYFEMLFFLDFGQGKRIYKLEDSQQSNILFFLTDYLLFLLFLLLHVARVMLQGTFLYVFFNLMAYYDISNQI